MWIHVLLVAIGLLVAMTGVLYLLSRQFAQQEFEQKVSTPVVFSFTKTIKSVFGYSSLLRSEAELLGTPEQAQLWTRIAILVACGVAGLGIASHIPLLVLIAPLTLVAPLVVVRFRRQLHVRQLKMQTRVVEILIASLMLAGASLSESLRILEQHMQAPIRDHLSEVNVKKRYLTLPGSLNQLAESTGISQLQDLATVVSESERHGTPVAEALQRSLLLEAKLRDTHSKGRFEGVQMQLSLIATLFIAMPGFGFAFYAMLQYMMQVFHSPFF